MISVSVVQNAVFDRLQAMVSNPQLLPGWWKRLGRRIYAEAQQARWLSEGGSEGYPWEPPHNPYATIKAKKYANSYGSGTKTLIAPSRLLASVLPPAFRGGAANPDGEEQYNEVTGDNTVVISSSARASKQSQPYGRWVNETRPFMLWGAETKSALADSFKSYMVDAAKARR